LSLEILISFIIYILRGNGVRIEVFVIVVRSFSPLYLLQELLQSSSEEKHPRARCTESCADGCFCGERP